MNIPEWQKWLGALMLGLLILWLWFSVRHDKNLFKKENWVKSFGFMGVLALILIGVIALVIFLLRH